MKKFTEQQTREFYNNDDVVYRSFWDEDGNCHWGYFPTIDTSFKQAMVELNKRMLASSGIDDTSKVLDLGCGNGNNAFFINKKTGANVIGIDLSDTRIKNAHNKLKKTSPKIKNSLKFLQSSATKLPFRNNTFTHVWSQATLYHVYSKKKALQEVFRVLGKKGIFIFDDLIKPNKKISSKAEKLVYERLLFNTDYNLVSYQVELHKLGFRVLYAEDLSEHYALSYLKLADIAEEMIIKNIHPEFHSHYKKLIHVYRETWGLMEKGDIGWAMFICVKE
jgi:ubiquinone/menaquinone biosynthesis C-methylase UbiE